MINADGQERGAGTYAEHLDWGGRMSGYILEAAREKVKLRAMNLFFQLRT